MKPRPLNVCLLLMAAALFGLSVHYALSSRLDGQADGTVIRIQQDPESVQPERSYDVYYQFQAEYRTVYNGMYLIEDPTALGDMPRMGSFVHIHYARTDPGINLPYTDETTDLSQVFFAGIALVLGVSLLITAIGLR